MVIWDPLLKLFYVNLVASKLHLFPFVLMTLLCKQVSGLSGIFLLLQIKWHLVLFSAWIVSISGATSIRNRYHAFIFVATFNWSAAGYHLLLRSHYSGSLSIKRGTQMEEGSRICVEHLAELFIRNIFWSE